MLHGVEILKVDFLIKSTAEKFCANISLGLSTLVYIYTNQCKNLWLLSFPSQEQEEIWHLQIWHIKSISLIQFISQIIVLHNLKIWYQDKIDIKTRFCGYLKSDPRTDKFPKTFSLSWYLSFPLLATYIWNFWSSLLLYHLNILTQDSRPSLMISQYQS